jgi:hypothetical protein
MAKSPHFRKLDRRLKQLRHHLLPKKYSPTGDYTSKQRDMAMAYRLLCHAEIEQYIEDSSLSVVQTKIASAKSSGRANLTALTLIAYHRTGWEGLLNNEVSKYLPKKKEERNLFKDPLGKLLDESLQTYRVQMVNNNNGIRVENLQKLLRPIGVNFDSLDEEWLIAIDDFGKLRGKIAHTSGVGITHLIDPKTEADLVTILLVGLNSLDNLLFKLLKEKE